MISFTRIKNGTAAELVAHKKNRVISLILLAFASVIYGFGTSMYQSSYRNEPTLDPSGLAIFLYFASLCCLYAACTGSFKDMHDRPSADVQMSMPLSGAERYLSRLLTVGMIWFFPFLILSAAGVLLAGANCAEKGFFIEAVKSSMRLQLWFIAAVMFIVSVTVVCQCCTGSKAESKYTPVLLMFVLSLAPAFLSEMSERFGSNSCGKSLVFYSIWSFSQLFMYEPNDSGFILYAVINCLISVAVLAGGLFLYKKRDARSVGIPVSYPLFLEITVFMSLTMLFCLVHESAGDFSIIVFFLAWLGSIILRIICARKSFSFKKIGIWTGLFAAYYIVFLIVMFIICKSGNFGTLYRKADLSPYMGSRISISADIAEDHYYDYNSERQRLLDSRREYVLSASSKASTEKLMDICARYAAKSSATEGLFSYRMFGNDDKDFFYCSLNIYKCDEEHSWRTEIIYDIDFKLKREDAVALRDELGSLGLYDTYG